MLLQPVPLAGKDGPGNALSSGMGTMVFKVGRKSGDYVRGIVVPANHSEESHFGLVDGVIIGFLLLCAASLACLLLLG